MKFECEVIKTLKTINSEGKVCILTEGGEVCLRLDFAHMNLYDHKSYIKRYPDGWVKGIIRSISDHGNRFYFARSDENCNLLVINPSDVLDVSCESQKTGLKIKDVEHLLPRYSDDSGFDVQIIYKKGRRLLAFEDHDLYRPDEHPEQRNLEIVSLLPGLTRAGGHYDDTFTIVVNGGVK